MNREITNELIIRVRDWLGKDGIKFFTDVVNKYGRIDACWSDGGIPHPVHFREGMLVRNFIRSTGLIENDAILLDDIWVEVIQRALEI